MALNKYNKPNCLLYTLARAVHLGGAQGISRDEFGEVVFITRITYSHSLHPKNC